MDSFGSKIGRGLFWTLVVATSPVWGLAKLVGKGLEKMGVNNPKRDEIDGYDPTAPENQNY